MRVLFIVNKGYDKKHLTGHIQRMRDYYSRSIKQTFGFKPIEIEYDIVDVDIDAKIKYFGINSLNQNFYGTANVKDEVRRLKLIPRGKYNVVFFCYNQPPLPSDAPENSYVAPMVYWKGIHPETEWSEIPYPHEPNTLKHEFVHAMCMMIRRQGINVLDQMDRTLWNGKWIPYFKNGNPFALVGNYSLTLAGLQPYIDKLDDRVKSYAKLAPPKIIKMDPKESDTIIDAKIVNSGFIQTPNVYKKTYDEEPVIHIIHKTLSPWKNALNWFLDKKSKSSAHFLYKRNGDVIQMASVKQRTWHSGITNFDKLHDRMSRRAQMVIINYGKNPNLYSLGHEFECLIGETYTEAQYNAFLKNIENLQKINNWENGVEELPETLFTHKEFVYYKPDLSKEWAMIVKRARQIKLIRLLTLLIAKLKELLIIKLTQK